LASAAALCLLVPLLPSLSGGSGSKPADPASVTASIPRADIAADEAPVADTKPLDLESVKLGLDALTAGDVDAARGGRDALPAGSLDRHVLSWAIAMQGGSKVSSAEIAATARDLPGWPGIATLRRNTERALLRENPPAAAVLKAFDGSEPQTANGAIILARALVQSGKADEARTMLGAFWRTALLDAEDETAILTEFGNVIAPADHRFRMERMLYAERVRSAERVAALANAEALQRAWAAVLRRNADAAKLLAAVPAEQRSAGYAFAEAKLARRVDDLAKAAKIMIDAPKDKAALVDPDAWWVERRVLARELMDAGKFKMAYGVAAAHAAESPANMVDAEFQAGWLALRALKQPDTAQKHFSRIAELADGPISRSRAYYWMGRATDAGGTGIAKDYYEKAAAYGTAFYGQLAAQKLGRVTIDVPYPEPDEQDRTDFQRREAVRAIDLLEAAGYPRLADRLYADLGEQLNRPGELALLTAKAEQRNNHFLALKIGKAAANRGIEAGALTHPIGVIPPSANISAAGKALAYAVARQESEFNVGAVSSAGARGLLQLMPGTAKDVARRNGLPFSQPRLTTDAGYNATLGAAFLGEQLDRFKGSYVLTFAGYNAGPGRAAQWISRYGDPRGKDLDAVIDWIERIPFTETRSYVQRVMENYQVYKMRLTGKFDIVADLTNGRRGGM